MNADFTFDKIVIQPTTLCNLNCTYCYLPGRNHSLYMEPSTVDKIAKSIETINLPYPISVIWHGGEPLSCGRERFSKLLEPLEGLEKEGRIFHSIQTNATLIDNEWCDLFINHRFKVGVSIDGPSWANLNRLNWSAREAFPQIMKGIEQLKKHEISFTVIAVVTLESIQKAQDIYNFFCELGCSSFGINIEEREGINLLRNIIDGPEINKFWDELFNAWRKQPTVDVREFSYVIGWMQKVCNKSVSDTVVPLDILPTVGWNGDVVVLSPELLGTNDKEYSNFIVGNVLLEPLEQIIENAKNASYVVDFLSGVNKCKATCDYYSFCGGGQAANKYYELGKINDTETMFCRNSKIRLVDAVLNAL